MQQETTTTSTSQNKDVPHQVDDIWRYLLSEKVYRRCLRREHNARNRNACRWCLSIYTTPYCDAWSNPTAPERVCENCYYVFSPPQIPPLLNIPWPNKRGPVPQTPRRL